MGSVDDEREHLKGNAKKRKDNIEYNYTIILGGKLVGGCGIKIRQHNTFIGEIGYFVDEAYWGQGIATKVVKMLESIGFNKLGLKRIEVIMDSRNLGSEKVAIKTGYLKEGTMKSAIQSGKRYFDGHLYAKVKK